MADLVYRNAKGSKLTKDEGDANQKALNIYSKIVSADWRFIPTMFRIYLNGSGTITIDAKNPAGTVTLAVYTNTLTNASNEIIFPFAGNDAAQIRITLTGTLTGEVL